MAKKKVDTEIQKEFPETIDHEFELTDEVISLHGQELANVLSQIADKQAELKSKTKDLKNSISILELQRDRLSTAINTKRETKTINCTVKYDDPQVMQKTYYYDGIVIKVEGMTPFDEERIQQLFPEPQEKAKVPSDENLTEAMELIKEPAEDLEADVSK